MKKVCLSLLVGIIFSQAKAQNSKDQQRLKSITLQAYESVSPSTRQWFIDVSEQHPPGDFDTAYAKKKLKEKFSPAQLDAVGNIFAVMIAYQKMMQKEAREDRKIQSQMKQIILADKAEKLKLNNKAIDEGMQEAKEKADRIMDAAAASLVMGIASGSFQIDAGSFSSHVDQNTVQATGPAVLKNQIKVKPLDSTRNKSADQHDKLIKKEPVPVYLTKLEVQLAKLKKGGY